MKSQKNHKSSLIFLFLITNIIFTSVYYKNLSQEVNSYSENDIDISDVELEGKIYSEFTTSSVGCYLNSEEPSLNIQPSIYIPNYNLSHADMFFDNITAINYTRDIETEASDFITSTYLGPSYFYQKFSVEIDQYVNNVSLFIQDINNNYNYSDENSWEVAILNCSNDMNGSPNTTISLLQKPHPFLFSAHWELFDFLNSDNGAVFLNTSHTNSTLEGGVTKYWFTFRIKVPPDDTYSGGGPKFLYFNPDDAADIDGEGDTFYNYLYAFDDTKISINNVSSFVNDSVLLNSSVIQGDLSSFTEIDEDRFISQAVTNNASIALNVSLQNLTIGVSYEELVNWVKKNATTQLAFLLYHFYYAYSFDFYLTINVSDISVINNSTLYLRNCTSGGWYEVIDMFNITQENETSLLYQIRDPFQKFIFMDQLINYTNNNSVEFMFLYNGTDSFNVSINQFKIEVVELDFLNAIQPYDPLNTELNYPKIVSLVNATTPNPFGVQELETLRLNDDDFYLAQADTDNLSVEFNFNLFPYLDSSLWEGVDFWDWQLLYPNPVVPEIEFRFSANVSIKDPANLTYAILELYKGDVEIDFLDDITNTLEWLPLSGPKDFAIMDETPSSQKLQVNETLILLQLLNTSDQNSLKFRLRYEGVPGFTKFNVSIDEFSLITYVQNAIPSDFTSKIGLGLNNAVLNASHIQLKSFGVPVIDGGIRNGIWEMDIQDGAPMQGYFEFNITSVWDLITFDVVGTYELYKVRPVIIFLGTAETQYMTGANVFSVQVSYHNGAPIENIEIIFELIDAEGRVVSQSTAISNEEGIAATSVDFSKVGEGYTVRARFAQEGIYASSELASESFRIVDELGLFIDAIQVFLPYILVLILVVGVTSYVMHRKKSKLRAIWAGQALILDDLLKISYIMVIHKDIGVSVYNKKISLEDLEPDLISGFLHAISQFRREISKDKDAMEPTKGKSVEMDYYDSKVVITEGEYIRVAFILDGDPSEQLKENQWKFTEQFENKFSKTLGKFDGDITHFRVADTMVEKLFHVSLMYPLQLGTHWEVSDLKPIEKGLLEVAEQMQKERKFFFVSSLLSYGIAGRKESRDQVISVIISLQERGLIIPIDLE